MGLLGDKKERGIQLLIRDDGDFLFRELDIQDSFLVEKDGHGNVIKAWMMPFRLSRKFDGLKGVFKAGRVYASYNRDIVYDPFKELGPGEKPEQGREIKKKFVTKIAEGKCYQHEHSHKASFFMDKFVLFLGGTMILLGLVIALAVGVK